VGVEYELGGRVTRDFPSEIEALEQAKVRYHVVPGWQESTYGLKDYAQLPKKAQDYLRFLADQVGVEIAVVSTGPERDQTIWMETTQFASSVVGAPR
jgi:adenylosuccinate synthase